VGGFLPVSTISPATLGNAVDTQPPVSAPLPPLDQLNADPNHHTTFKSLFDTANDEQSIQQPSITSLFHDTYTFNGKYSSTSKPIIMSINIQSLQSKHGALQQLLGDICNESVPVQIIAMQETWKIQYPEYLGISNYKLYNTNRAGGMRGGGVGFYVHEDLTAEVLQSTNIAKVFECMTIQVNINGKKYKVSSVYRSPTPPPNMSPAEQLEQFNQHLEALMQATAQNNVTSVICLDSNINAHTVTAQHSNYEYFQTIQTNGFTQCINKSTRVQGSTSTLIDHILTNATTQHIESGTIISDISDHFITFIVTPQCLSKVKKRSVLTRNFSAQNVERFRIELSGTGWEDVLGSTDIETSHRLFTEKFNKLYDRCFPAQSQRFNKNRHKINNYMSTALLISRQTKLRLHKASISTPTRENIQQYKQYRNAYNRVVRASKKRYFEENLSQSKNNPRRTWELIKEAMNTQKATNKIEKISVEGKTITNPKEMADSFGAFFAGAGVKVAQAINSTKHTPEEYMPEPCQHELHLGAVSSAEVVRVLREMQSKSSQDINGLSVKILQGVAMEVSAPLTHIFNLSLEQGIFPEPMKTSRIVPIHKGGVTDLCDNYRPIALLNTLTKALEKIVANKLTQHLTQHKLLHPGQFGFQKGKNTEQNLVYTISSISNSINRGEYCLGVFLDLRKAFDVCSHEIMLKKLNNMGVRGVALNWFQSYLTGRKQCVDVQGHLSDPASIDGISIIQGGTLGPILFNIYINDLPRSTSLQAALFADDTSGLNMGKNLPALIDSTNVELKKMAAWFRANRMAVNTAKTKYIIFHSKGKSIDTQGKQIIYDDNEEGENDDNKRFVLERVHNNNTQEHKTYKLLGVLLDEHLSFDANTQALVAKLSKSIYCINRVKNVLPQKALMHLYHSLIQSHLQYCITVASSTSSKNIEKITKMQKKGIRAASKAGYRDHTGPLFSKHNTLPYKDMILQAQLHIMHSVYHKYAPEPLLGLWSTNADRNIEHELRNAADITVPRANNAQFTKTPPYTFAKVWNEAPAIKYTRNALTFRIGLKTDLLQKHNPAALAPDYIDPNTGIIIRQNQHQHQHQHWHQHQHQHQHRHQHQHQHQHQHHQQHE